MRRAPSQVQCLLTGDRRNPKRRNQTASKTLDRLPGRRNIELYLLIIIVALFLAVEAHAAACNDGLDNDADGQVDYPADPGCFAGSDDSEQQPHAGPIVGGIYMPTLEDERATYRAWSWSWQAEDEPNYTSAPGYSVNGPDIHYDTEGDDLWSYLMMYIRTGQRGYLDRARAWARYFKEDYRTCIGPDRTTFCFDRNSFSLDHLYGWGLVAWYEYTGDNDALAEASNIAAEVETYWAALGSAPGTYSVTKPRQVGRHLILLTRLADVTRQQRWIDLRNYLIELFMQAPNWDSRGVYWSNSRSTDQVVHSGAYDEGFRIQTPFQIAVAAEALFQAYRATRREDIKNRIIAMARFVDQYGMEPTYQYATSWFGLNINTNVAWYNYTANGTPTFWDPVYTQNVCNLLVMASRLDGDPALYNRAKYFFNRGSKASSRGPGGGLPERTALDNEVDHFVDTEFTTSQRDFYLGRNRGELQYTYLLFDPASRANGDFDAPSPPGDLRVE